MGNAIKNSIEALTPSDKEVGLPIYQTRQYMELNGWKEAKEYLDQTMGREEGNFGFPIEHSEAFMLAKFHPKNTAKLPHLQTPVVPARRALTEAEQQVFDKFQKDKRLYGIAGPLLTLAAVTAIAPRRLGVFRLLPGAMPAMLLRGYVVLDSDREMINTFLLSPDLPMGQEMREIVRRRFPTHPVILQFDQQRLADPNLTPI